MTEKIHCPIYRVDNSPRACAIRWKNANTQENKWRPGQDDPACRDCDIGRDLYRAGHAAGKETIMNTTPEKLVCPDCQGEFTPEEMGTHPVSGKPWQLCPNCRKARQAKGKARKRAEKGKARKPSPGQAGPTLTLDFTGREELLAALEKQAEEMFRDPENQLLYLLKTYLHSRQIQGDKL